MIWIFTLFNKCKGFARFTCLALWIKKNRAEKQKKPLREMATTAVASPFPSLRSRDSHLSRLLSKPPSTINGGRIRKSMPIPVKAKQTAQNNALQYRKLGDSDLQISEITIGTMTFGEQNTEKEAHDMLSYSFEQGINTIDTAEAYPIPMKKETQGRTDLYIGSWIKSRPREKVILATKVCGYSEWSSYIRDNAKVLRVDAANIKESVEKSLKRLNTDYIDLLQIHWPDRYVPLFGEFNYDPSKWRPSIPISEQLKAFQDLIDEGKIRYIGVSNETSYGVMEFVHAAKVEGLPKIVSIQNSYSLLLRCRFEIDLVEVCHPNNYNIGLLAYSPLGAGTLSGKYLDINSEAAKKGRLNLFPGYMERYNKALAKEVTKLYIELAKKHGLTPVQLALGFTRDRSFVTSSIIGATSMEQLKEDIDAFTATTRPLPPEVATGIADIFKRHKDPAII
ncbi:Aldo-keto reductase protein [Dioscorea alata]|uniref:Aldo-keto reductase protein n=1 Tax=Dioscorea alata TaxID=55571 RepID=A0ACB7V8Y2_DIOAL|nr:Aldo-keto reductase protein [Dioscorea alata]